MRFLVAVDGSDPSIDALQRAITFAEGMNAELTITYAVTPQVKSRGGERIIEDTGEAEDRGDRVLSDAADIAGEAGFDPETKLLYGRPAERIAEYANEEDFDVVFVGHRGLSREREEVVGSVAKDLLSRSRVPVMVVR